MRYFYSFLLYLISPCLVVRLLWRSKKDKAYRKRISERFGFYDFTLAESIWLHAVSVGEAIVATPIIDYLIKHYPHKKILITTTTPTGSEQIQKTFGNKVSHVYLPYDLPDAMQRFINKMHPIIAIIIETEIWPNFIATCARSNIPICLLNARLSAPSFKRYQKIARFSNSLLSRFSLIAAVSEKDAARFKQLGAPQEVVKTTGNIKFDLQLMKDVMHLSKHNNHVSEQLINHRYIWVAASTHSGEEDIILSAHKMLRAQVPNTLLILVPRHRDRFDDVYNLCQKHSLLAARFSDGPKTIADDVAVFVGDVIGELMHFYAMCDVAFIGGSLIPHGGHNMIEPATLGKPVLIGPHYFNFVGESEPFLQKRALIVVENAEALANQLILLLKDEVKRQAIGDCSKEVVLANRGALDKQLRLLETCLTVT